MKANTLESLSLTLWDRVEKGDPEGCWNWIGAKSLSGYGLVRMKGKWSLTHRVAWTIVNGDIGQGLNVLHRCDNPPCINPKHLFLGTQGDNNRDRSSKGRTRVPIGTEQNFSKLNDDYVIKIRDMHAKGMLMSHLAILFNVDHGTIRAVVNRRTWKHVHA